LKKLLNEAKDRRGFTLIELIVSITILAIVIVPTLGLFSAAFKNNRYAKEKLVAIALAQGRIEELKAMNYQNLIGQEGTTAVEKDGTKYSIITIIEPINEGEQGAELLDIKVIVSWADGQVSLSTIKGK